MINNIYKTFVNIVKIIHYNVSLLTRYVDDYMNILLINAEEHENGSMSANFGKVVIRGNNVLFINILPDIPL